MSENTPTYGKPDTLTVKEYRQNAQKPTKNTAKGKKNSDILHNTQTTIKSALKSIKRNKYLHDMLLTLKLAAIPYEIEFKFHPKRKWRSDIHILEKGILIEYDGLLSNKSRHTTLTGFSNDCEKRNQATILGYKVLTYTVLNYKTMIDDLRSLLK